MQTQLYLDDGTRHVKITGCDYKLLESEILDWLVLLATLTLMLGWNIETITTKKSTLRNLINFTLENNFDQIVNFDTWSRTIKGVKKAQSLITFIQTVMSLLVM